MLLFPFGKKLSGFSSGLSRGKLLRYVNFSFLWFCQFLTTRRILELSRLVSGMGSEKMSGSQCAGFGGSQTLTFMTYNPSAAAGNWSNWQKNTEMKRLVMQTEAQWLPCDKRGRWKNLKESKSATTLHSPLHSSPFFCTSPFWAAGRHNLRRYRGKWNEIYR